MATDKDAKSLSKKVEQLTLEDKRRPVSFCVQLSSYNCVEVSVEGQHLSVEVLREKIKKDTTIMQQVQDKRKDHPRKACFLDYLLPLDHLPKFPTPVEFHISHVCHATTDEPARSIVDSEEFQGGVHKDKKYKDKRFSWWSLQIDDKEIIAAGRRYMERHKQMELPEDFLTKFTTSPVFPPRPTPPPPPPPPPKSRYGNYRFTFQLEELMKMYKEQFCGGQEPVLSVFETRICQQEIMYAVLVHSPKDKGELEGLEKSDFVRYQDGKIIWRAQAICDPITHKLNGNKVEKVMPKCYVWDHVCLAFCLTDNKSLNVPREKLIVAVEACKIAEENYVEGANTKTEIDRLFEDISNRETERDILFHEAKDQVEKWKNELQKYQK